MDSRPHHDRAPWLQRQMRTPTMQGFHEEVQAFPGAKSCWLPSLSAHTPISNTCATGAHKHCGNCRTANSIIHTSKSKQAWGMDPEGPDGHEQESSGCDSLTFPLYFISVISAFPQDTLQMVQMTQIMASEGGGPFF